MSLEPGSIPLPPVPPPDITRFVGRQPIFDRNQHIFGYELLFRSSLDNWADLNSESITMQTLDDMLLLGLDTVVPEGKAWVNCDRRALLDLTMTLLPANRTVVEVLETVVADDEIVAACKAIKDLGYQIALDDFLPGQGCDALIPLADYIKLDFRASTPESLRQIRLTLGRKDLALLAEKVETEEEFERAKAEGYAYFQGYFFSRPAILQGRAIPSNQMLYIQLLRAVNTSPMDVAEVEKLIMAEASLCFRVLRVVNSASVALRGEVTSIRHALRLLGEDQMRKLVSVAAAASLAHNGKGSSQLILLALHRARFCELLAPDSGQNSGEQYLIGLISTLDAILKVPMPQVLKMLPLRREAASALLGEDGPVATLLQLFLALERCDGQRCATLCAELHIPVAEATDIYVKSLQWANHALVNV